MKLNLRFIALVIAVSFGNLVMAETEGDLSSVSKAYSQFAKLKCDSNLAEKQKKKEYSNLKIVNSALGVACFITAKTSIEDCHAKAVAIVKDYIATNDQSRSKNMLQESISFCTSYGDVVSNVIVESVIEDALKNKISVDEAAKNLINKSRSK